MVLLDQRKRKTKGKGQVSLAGSVNRNYHKQDQISQGEWTERAEKSTAPMSKSSWTIGIFNSGLVRILPIPAYTAIKLLAVC